MLTHPICPCTLAWASTSIPPLSSSGGARELTRLHHAEPALYDSHIRRFQTNDEKLRDVQGRGFAERLEQGMLLWQDRARQRETQTGPTQEQDAPPSPCSSYTLGRSTRPSRPGSAEPETRPAVECPDDTPDRPSFMWLEPEEELRSPATSREDGILKWTALLRKKFILGEDDEFDYSTVDDNEKYDVHLKQEREEAW